MTNPKFENHDMREPLVVCKACGSLIEYRKKATHSQRCEKLTQLLSLFDGAKLVSEQDALPPF